MIHVMDKANLTDKIDEFVVKCMCLFPQVASLTILDKKLYVGTSWGCLIVADAHTMRPISVFRPFSEEIQAIIPIPTATAAAPPEQGNSVS